MATLIKIKRGAAASETAPGQLGAGELAITYGDAAGQANGGDRLYIGNSPGNANLVIGGKYFADLMDHVHGTLTASSGLIADSNSKLDNLKVDNLDLNGNIISTTDTNGEMTLKPHGTAGVGILAGGSSTSAALKLYEASTNGSHSITVKAPAAVTADVTLTLPDGDGDANNMLTTNGSGVLAWTAGVSGTTGTFSGAVSATTGTFTALVDAEIGSLGQNVRVGVTAANEIDTSSGNLILDSAGGTTQVTDALDVTGTLTGVIGQFSGAVSGTTGTFTGAVSGTTGTFTGVVDAEVGAHGANVRIGIGSSGEIDTSSGNLTIDSAGGTVTVDDNFTISASKTIDMGANKITNVADPTSAQDTATKAYVDAVKQGLDIKDSVSCATTADISTWTYHNGNGTLTANGNGAVSLDSVALTLNMRVLVKNQDPATENGIYYVSTAGAGGATLVLTRATDANTGAELSGGTFTFVEQGTVAAENGYVFTHNGDATFGSTALTVSQFSGAGQVIAGTSLTKTGNTMNVATDDATVFTLSDALSIRSTGTGGQILRSIGNAAAAAVWGQVDLADSDAVTGISAVANGGTGASSLTANRLMMANGTSALTVLGAGTQDQVMLSNAGSAPAFGNIDGGTF